MESTQENELTVLLDLVAVVVVVLAAMALLFVLYDVGILWVIPLISVVSWALIRVVEGRRN